MIRQFNDIAHGKYRIFLIQIYCKFHTILIVHPYR